MNDLASEFFYDIIARIPAGLLVIVLFWRREAENVFHAHLDFFSPIPFIACILAVAWLVGLMVEAITFVPIAYALRWLSPYCRLAAWFRLRLLGEPTPQKDKPSSSIERITALENENATLTKENASLKKENAELRIQVKRPDSETANADREREKRRQDYFAIAVTIMSRCIAFILLIAVIHPPERFSNFCWHRYYFGIVGCSAFLLLWFLLKGYMNQQMRRKDEYTH